MIKLIISDVDGTLVGDGQSAEAMNPEYYKVIAQLKEQGITFMACSGRQYVSIAKLFAPIENEILYGCDGGSLVFENNKVLYAQTLPKAISDNIIQDAMEIPQCDILVAGTKRAYCRSKDSELYRWLKHSYGFDIKAVGDLTKNIPDDIVKISLYHKNQAEALTSPWFRPKWENKVKLSLAGIQWLDCVPKEAGKKSAVAFVQKHLNIKPEETIVFGDNQNDIEMFSLAHRSYAVENARLEVKREASDICESYDRDGVLKILKNVVNSNNISNLA